jgi:acyl-CoA synthetase (NDP forming)
VTGARSERDGGPAPGAATERDGALAPLLAPRRVAVVGATPRAGAVGHQLVRMLRRSHAGDALVAVNPRYDEVEGVACVDDLAHAGAVDLALLCVANERLERALVDCADAGVRAAAIYASAAGTAADGTPLRERLAAVARAAGIAICGANGVGFLNFADGVWACPFYEHEQSAVGAVALVSHSGSAFTALVHNDRGVAFNLAVSAGQELTTTAADYVMHALALPSTRVVALFLETVRDPAAFTAALAQARRQQVPVVALKVGAGARSRALVQAHSGALAGDDGAYEALFESHGVLRVRTLDELLDTVALLAAGRRAAPGGFASVHESGGERALVADVAEQVGLDFAPIGDATVARLAAVLDPGLEPGNPLDFWDTGRDADAVLLESLTALADDPAVGALALGVDLTPDTAYAEVAQELWRRTAKPFAVVPNLSSGVDRAQLPDFGEIPVLRGTRGGALAFGHLLRQRDELALPPAAPAAVDEVRRAHWSRRLAAGDGEPSEADALALLDAYGVATVARAAVASRAEALRAAERIGWPVALKTAAPGIAHKSDVGGVVLAIADAEALAAAYDDLAARLGPQALVAQMAAPGVELMLGLTRDPDFGLLVVVGVGGTLVELLGDRALALPGLDRRRARRLLDKLAGRRLLDGVRGRPAADVDAVVEAIVAVSQLAQELGDDIDALDVNPLIASAEGCVAADALLVRRTKV